MKHITTNIAVLYWYISEDSIFLRVSEVINKILKREKCK